MDKKTNAISIPTYLLSQISSKLNRFEIRKVRNTYDRNAVHTAHKHAYFSVIMHLKGLAKHVLDFNVYELSKPSLVCITPDQIHLPLDSENFEAVIISFTPDFPLYHTLFPELNASPDVLIPDAETLKMLQLLADVMLLEYRRGEPDERLLKNTLDSFILLINEITAKQAFQSVNDAAFHLTLQYKDLLNKHFIQLKQVAEYAGLLHVTASHLNDAVKKITKKTAKEMIIERLITEAKRMLYFENLSIKEIAAYLDFNEINYFNLFFKKHAGMTPVTYRSEIRKKYS